MRRINNRRVTACILQFSVVVLLFFSASGLTSCGIHKALNVTSYDEFAEVSNTFWTNLYLTFNEVQMLGYDRVIFKDEHWKKKDSPIVITGKVYVLPGVTITVDPGVKVLLGEDTLITCQGLMIAEGTEDAPITFTWKDEGKYWDTIECVSSIKKTKKDRGTVVFRYCIVEHGKGLKTICSNVDISHCTFRHNVSSALKIEYSSGIVSDNLVYGNSTERETESGNAGGIKVYTNLNVQVLNNEVYDNISIGGRDGGGGIYAFAYDKGQVLVSGNTVKNNRSDRKGGGIFAYDAQIRDNTVIDNHSDMTGGGIFAIQSRVENNVVTGNSSDEGGGVFSDASTVSGNLIRGNWAPKGSGLFHMNAGSVEKNTFVDNKGPGAAEDTAIAVMGNPRVTRNNIIAEKGYALSFLAHSLSPDLDANGNYWGTDDEQVIENKVCDWLEHSDVGIVGWKAFDKIKVAEAPAIPDGAVAVLPAWDRKAERSTIRGVVENDRVLGGDDIRQIQVTANLLVREGKTLTLAPGTVLSMAPGASIRVRGKFVAQGEKNRIITVTGDPEKPWGSLLFENRSLSDGGVSETEADKSLIRHCVIENGSGIVMDGKGADVTDSVIRNHKGTGLRIKEAEASIIKNTISGNISESDGGGIYAYGSRTILIHDNRIVNNRAGDGGGIFAYGQQSNVAVDIRRNRIENNSTDGSGGGIWVSRSAVVDNTVSGNTADSKGGGIYASFALVHDNRITANKSPEGSGVYGESNSSFIGNDITGNTCRDKNGGAVYLNYWGLSLHNKHFMNNLIEGNTSEDKDGTGGICVSGEMDFKNNAISRNTGIQLYNLNPFSDVVKTTASLCFWGSTDVSVIDAMIFDGKDDPALSQVIYEPMAKNAGEALSQAREVSDKDEAVEEY